MDFGEALKLLKAGKRVTRSGWNGKGMWLALMTADDWGLREGAVRNDGKLPAWLEGCGDLGHFIAPFIVMRTADERLVPWLASQTDILGADWIEHPNRTREEHVALYGNGLVLKEK